MEPRIVCGVVIYNINYMKTKKEQLEKWKEMNPQVDFKILTVPLNPDDMHRFSELNFKDIEVISIPESNILSWLKNRLLTYKIPIHYLSDIMRWYCLQFLISTYHGSYDYFCVMEADLICNTENWMNHYFKTNPEILNNKLTIFGEDRAFITYHNAYELLNKIIMFFEFVYIYIVSRNHFDKDEYILDCILEIINDDRQNKENIEENTEKCIEEKIKGKFPIPHDERGFINQLQISRLGIGIRKAFDFNFTFKSNEIPFNTRTGKIDCFNPRNLLKYPNDPEYALRYYTHTKHQCWKQEHQTVMPSFFQRPNHNHGLTRQTTAPIELSNSNSENTSQRTKSIERSNTNSNSENGRRRHSKRNRNNSEPAERKKKSRRKWKRKNTNKSSRVYRMAMSRK
jgi:hypothetical protein